MRKIEKTIYNFDELDKEIQEKLIKEEKEYCFNAYIGNFFQDDMEHKAQELVDDYFGSDTDFIQTYYSLSYCQGDGAMIEFDIDIKDLNNKYKVFTDDEIEFLKQKDVINTIRVRHYGNLYYHEYTFGIDHDYYNDWEFEDIKDDFNITEDGFNTLWDRFDKLTDDSNKHYTDSEFIKDIIKMNRELVRFGYNTLENYEEDTDFVIENLSGNEYYENGDVYYG
jgi:hypothetical protein